MVTGLQNMSGCGSHFGEGLPASGDLKLCKFPESGMSCKDLKIPSHRICFQLYPYIHQWRSMAKANDKSLFVFTMLREPSSFYVRKGSWMYMELV